MAIVMTNEILITPGISREEIAVIVVVIVGIKSKTVVSFVEHHVTPS